MKKAQLVLAAIFGGIAVVIIGIARTFPPAKDSVPGPGAWPIIAASVMLFACAVIAFSALKQKQENEIGIFSSGCIRVYISMGILILYTLGIYVIGFCTATALMLFIFINWFGRYQWYKTALLSVIITFLVYAVFHYVLKVPFRFGLLF